MSSSICPKPGDILEEIAPRSDFKARYIVLSVHQDKHAITHGKSYRLYTLYVESSSLSDRELQGTIDVVYDLEMSSRSSDQWSIIS